MKWSRRRPGSLGWLLNDWGPWEETAMDIQVKPGDVLDEHANPRWKLIPIATS